ncbi:MAG: arylsulfatase [Phycisphaerales bacterium]|nr:MAG: arylsulfatase [Phycisphaerales bacterium]
MNRREFLRVAGLLPLAAGAFGKVTSGGADWKRPNIIFIMADDMGYGDVKCYNPDSKIPTPHMDALASEGMRFTDAHSPSAVCTPTRYGILTGRYCWRTWLKSGVVGGYTNPLIEPTRTTVASLLKEHGYTTACIGKWHLGLGWTRANGYVGSWKDAKERFGGSWQDGAAEKGMNVDFTKAIQGGPTDLGFDYGYFTAACSTIDGPFCYIENDRTVGIPDKPIFVDKNKHPDYRPRRGLVAPGYTLEDVDATFTGKAVDFIRRSVTDKPERPFFVYLALSSPHAPWLPPDFVRGKSEAGPRGDLVFLVDWCVGQVVQALEWMKLAGDTLLIVTSDNGPREGVAGHKPAGNLRGLKSHTWEGGHRVPFIARWPGRIAAGTTSDEPVCLVDLMATAGVLAGAKLGAEAGPDSYNILPALLSEPLEKPIREAIVSHSVFGVFAIRQGPWKLILDNQDSGGWVRPAGKRPKPGTPGQLYNLKEDPAEQNNLFDKHPEIVRRLTDLLERYKKQGRSAPVGHVAGGLK